ncbi:dTDP-4-dehydrorhamnose reductase [Halanaerobium saccharolyticum]|uniref:dTDP-4-dehydrorhamnose reductase n=1 Tax=Halanaerobium saccharolyticum TaxID=43595 RepID=A0A4V3G5K8_9FIRM|nr:dTDP-4-dehydrorhamnose reductase [Halanaerobium saccharolyticum]RAK12621.1 dTDP-4-dehydrorhamnose reductase [Halanaerobium saccharolyticum]TDW05467.1 dTDP-4-dehydrorhamnose reductase [Halanaerobium saccharolyticum]TDX62982.1 dTDP-4-dehydrorhamnose reductase [Halanaerobium saccharolyticum]
MKVLVTGGDGQLGYDLVKKLNELDIGHIGVDKEDFDLTNEKETKDFILNYNPDIIVHCAAYTDVDQAEIEKELCYQVNVEGTKHLAEAAKVLDAKMLYISTDYVFDGQGKKPFEVTDQPNPINYYGETKYKGEQEVQRLLDKYFIIRTSWVFGGHGENFVKTMLRLGKEKDKISVVADQYGSPTYTGDLADLIIKMIKTDKYAIYHATNEGFCNWYNFAKEIFKFADIDIKINPISSDKFETKVKRPKNSRLSKKTLIDNGFCCLNNYKDAIHFFINEKTNI